MYLHCHTKNCNWSQDDFYSKNYNPLTKIISNIKWLGIPRLIKFDRNFVTSDAAALQKYTKIKVLFINNTCFSWNWLLLSIVQDLRTMFDMTWWSYKRFERDYNNGAVCPKCGQRDFDID